MEFDNNSDESMLQRLQMYWGRRRQRAEDELREKIRLREEARNTLCIREIYINGPGYLGYKDYLEEPKTDDPRDIYAIMHGVKRWWPGW